MRKMLPVISVVGNSGVGKTTFLEKLIPELKRRGYRVAAIKHDAHKFEVDYPGKDSWRLTQAGSDVTVISSHDKMAMMERLENELDLNQIVEMVRDRVDIVVTEGYRGAAAAKIEVWRREHSRELTAPLSDLIALVTDQPFEMGVPEFGLDDSSAVAGFIEDKFRPRPSRPLDRVFG